MRRALPDRSLPGLHAEPLDVTIRQLLASYCPGVSAMVIDNGDTTYTHKKLLALRYDIVHHAYTKLVKKVTKGNLYSSNLKFEFVEIAIDSKKAGTISNFSSYQTLKLDKNLWRNSSPKKLKKKLTVMTVNSC